jgi:pimeloyl-ACP methyl ester carboxylesterase
VTPTLVLVHGAFHGPWCFDLIRPLLHDRGITTVAPELPFVSLAGDVAAVKQAIDAIDGPVVLLGHSYAGTVITWAGEHPSVQSLIYVTAGVPDVGEGVGSGPTPSAPRRTLPGFTVSDDGMMSVATATAMALFYPDADHDLATACCARLRPSPSTAGEVVPVAAWRHLPSDYIICRDDRVLPAATQRWLADRAGSTIHELPGDHSPFLARPAALVEIIARIL